MKKILAIAIALLLLMTGCSEKQNKFEFNKANYPKMGGSLAALPLGEALTATALNIDRDEASEMIIFEGSTTDNYKALIDGTFDIILAYEPSEEAKEYIKNSGFDIEYQPIGIDALVFITGVDNPVTGLTTQQIKDIYSGKIKKWSEVGGEGTQIIAYQRNKDSGSQTLFDKLLNLGDALIKPQPDYIVGSMIGILEAVADYSGTDDALGYTVYYYLTNMESNKLEGSKLLDVDGVTPSNETIKNGQYPLTNDFYVVIKKETPKDSPTRILYDWILSQQGKQIAQNENYVTP